MINSMSLTSFIQTSYNIVHSNPNVNTGIFDNVEQFLLCDDDGKLVVRIVNTLFIQTYSTLKDVILIEGMPARSPVKGSDSPQTALLESRENIFGWDHSNEVAYLNRKENKERRDKEIKMIQLAKKLIDAVPNQKKKIQEEFDNIVQQLRTYTIDLDQLYENTIQFRKDRQKSLLDTLLWSSETFKKTRTFAIAGRSHFYVEMGSKQPNDELKKYIENHRVVVLEAKDNDFTRQLALPITEAFREIGR